MVPLGVYGGIFFPFWPLHLACLKRHYDALNSPLSSICGELYFPGWPLPFRSNNLQPLAQPTISSGIFPLRELLNGNGPKTHTQQPPRTLQAVAKRGSTNNNNTNRTDVVDTFFFFDDPRKVASSEPRGKPFSRHLTTRKRTVFTDTPPTTRPRTNQPEFPTKIVPFFNEKLTTRWPSARK